MKKLFLAIVLLPLLFITTPDAHAQTWTAKLDKTVRFYQTTDMGVLIAGTEKSLYAIDASTGETLWRRKDVSLDETDVAPVPATDLLLLNLEKGDRTRVEAVDILSGDTIWKSDKIRGSVMQMAVDPAANLLAVVLTKDAKGKPDRRLQAPSSFARTRSFFRRRDLEIRSQRSRNDAFALAGRWRRRLHPRQLSPAGFC